MPRRSRCTRKVDLGDVRMLVKEKYPPVLSEGLGVYGLVYYDHVDFFIEKWGLEETYINFIEDLRGDKNAPVYSPLVACVDFPPWSCYPLWENFCLDTSEAYGAANKPLIVRIDDTDWYLIIPPFAEEVTKALLDYLDVKTILEELPKVIKTLQGG